MQGKLWNKPTRKKRGSTVSAFNSLVRLTQKLIQAIESWGVFNWPFVDSARSNSRNRWMQSPQGRAKLIIIAYLVLLCLEILEVLGLGYSLSYCTGGIRETWTIVHPPTWSWRNLRWVNTKYARSHWIFFRLWCSVFYWISPVNTGLAIIFRCHASLIRHL